MMRGSTEERAVSITTGYIINIAIATMAVSIIMFSLQGLFVDIQEDSKNTEMKVVGEKVAWELEKADRMMRLGGADGEVTLETEDVGSYSVNITQDEVVLNGGRTSVTVEHDVESTIEGTPVGFSGGQSRTIKLNEPSSGEMSIE